MSTARRLHHSYEDYLRLLEQSATKLEYCDGEIFAMAGGTPSHGRLSARMIRILGNALSGRCEVQTSDVKIRVEATDLSTYPDVSVVCGPTMVSGLDKNAVTNPSLLVEVTSLSTEDYDRGEKLSHYKQLPSVRAVLFVSHRRPEITVVSREGKGFTERVFRLGEEVTLSEPECTFSVEEVYSGLELEPG